MRYIALDTETTGLDPKNGHRVIEIGCVEIVNRHITSHYFHYYLNPERSIDEGAFAVHGLSETFLQDKPKFAEIIPQFLDYIQGGHLLIHNAPFDLGFLNHELALCDKQPIQQYIAGVTDTLLLARDLYPGRKNSLDALCERLAVDNAHRQFHGALLDAQLLAEVYLSMTRGQESLAIELDNNSTLSDSSNRTSSATFNSPVIVATPEETRLHETYLEQLQQATGHIIWK